MLYRFLSPALIVIGLGLLGVGGYLALEPDHYVEAQSLDHELDATVGQPTAFFLRLNNRSGSPVRIVGVGFC